MTKGPATLLRRTAARALHATLTIAALLTLALLAGCGVASGTSSSTTSSSTAAITKPAELRVSAVVAVQDVAKNTAADFEKANNCTLVYNFAAAGVLETQIENGSEADVLLASPKEMGELAQKGLVSRESTKTFATNDLVIMVPAGNPAGVKGPSDLARLKTLTTGDPKATAQGPKAQEWLTNIGLWDSLKPKFVYAQNAGQIIKYVAGGEVDAGVGFASNVAADPGLATAYVVPKSQYKPILHVAAPITSSKKQDLAAKYIAYLGSAQVQQALVKAGFKLPTK
jgi:molybdate transport system substrate-binding protein